MEANNPRELALYSPLCLAVLTAAGSNVSRLLTEKSSLGVTPNAEASKQTSASLIRRTRASIFASVPRESAQPFRWHFAASASCEIPLATRKRRTFGPMMFCCGIAPQMELDEYPFRRDELLRLRSIVFRR